MKVLQTKSAGPSNGSNNQSDGGATSRVATPIVNMENMMSGCLPGGNMRREVVGRIFSNGAHNFVLCCIMMKKDLDKIYIKCSDGRYVFART